MTTKPDLLNCMYEILVTKLDTFLSQSPALKSIPYLEVVWAVYSSWHTNQLGEYSLTSSQTRSHQQGWTHNLHIVTELCSVWSQSLLPPKMPRQCHQWHPYCSSQLQPSCQHVHLSNMGLDWPVEKISTIMDLIQMYFVYSSPGYSLLWS